MKKKKIAAILPALVLFAGILFFTLQDSSLFQKKNTYPIVIFGDSIMGNVQDETSIPAKLSELLEVPVLNGAFGGTCATRTNAEMQASFVSDNLCLSSLAESVAYQDFGVLNASVAYGLKYQDINRQVLPYFEETIRQFKTADFDKTEILLLAYGTNDYTKAAMLDNPDDPYDRNSFGGSLRYSIELLQKKYPNMQIVLVTPVFCVLFTEEGIYDCTELDFGAGYMKEFAEVISSVGREYGLPVIDNYEASGIHRENWEQFLEDGIHPNEAGRTLLAERIAKELKSLLANRSDG